MEIDQKFNHFVRVLYYRLLQFEIEFNFQIFCESREDFFIIVAHLHYALDSLRDKLRLNLEEWDQLECVQGIALIVFTNPYYQSIDSLRHFYFVRYVNYHFLTRNLTI